MQTSKASASSTPMTIKEIKSKSALVKCGIPRIDFVINPYIGCRFGCTYCYAVFMCRFIEGVEVKDWGNFVHVKTNVPDLLKKELPKLFEKKGEGKEVLMSSVTDPYQGIEVKYKLARRCLENFIDFDFQGVLSILTKSPLVTRDIDLLKNLSNAHVGLTVTSTDDAISRYFEKNAPNVSDRFKALETLNKAGIPTYAFIGPLLPHFVTQKNELENIVKKLKKTGTRDVFIEHLNLTPSITARLFADIKGDHEILKKFYKSQDRRYRNELNELVQGLIKNYEMNLIKDTVIFHKEYQKRVE